MPFNPKFTITPKINKALVEVECVSACKLNAQTAVELDTLLPAVLDKAFKGEL
ncbi:MAG: hypothetical protein UZ01_01644 [Candidatus Brocadia sinica]|nr:MAG: hypothetical protein UZ01_01644 [Candidatus Brocadia sinica]MCK6466945.1 hypothetical protein [Candidatus Brocadia sinica]